MLFVCWLDDPPPFIDGVRINSPHYLCKLKLSATSSRKYTLVVSQYEKMHTIYYTLRAYATCPFKLDLIKNPFIHSKKVFVIHHEAILSASLVCLLCIPFSHNNFQISDGQWKGASAGGCANHPGSYLNNPRYLLVLESPHNNNHVLFDLKGPKQYQIGLDLIAHEANSTREKKRSSGLFR